MTEPGSLTSGFHSHLAAAWFWEVSGAGVTDCVPVEQRALAALPSQLQFLRGRHPFCSSLHSLPHDIHTPASRAPRGPGTLMAADWGPTAPPHPWLIPLISMHFWEFLPPRSRAYLPFSPNQLYKLFWPIEMGKNDVSGPQEPRSFCARSRGTLKPQCWKQPGRKGPTVRGPASQLSPADLPADPSADCSCLNRQLCL